MSDPDDNLVLFRRIPSKVRRREVQEFARVLRDSVAGGCPFECLVTGDDELRQLNREYRGKDYATDVLSFPVERQTGTPAFLGSLAVSAQRAAEQARAYGHSVQEEIQILMLHGLLHLLGMDHETDRGQMGRAERRWRAKLGLRVGLIERVGA